MAKGVEKDALANSGTASGQSGTLAANASNIYGTLAPQLQAEAAHPAGYSPTQKAAMNTAAQQSAGGSNSGVTGQGALLAARTRNKGAAAASVSQGARQASQNLSDAALNTETQNANLQQKQQQAAYSGLEGLNSTELGGSMSALGLSNQSLNTANQAAANNPWMHVLDSTLQAAGKVGGAYAGRPGQ